MRASAPDRFRRVDAVFDAVLELATDEQASYIERACSDDPALRDEVLQLLRAHHHVGGILDTPPAKLIGAFNRPETSPGPDERIGPFRIIRPLGQGGMGVVYLGIRDDDQFEQRVALKLIRHPSDVVMRRFFEERRILAWLEHPRIARLIDGGISRDGMPYFAMEYVDGMPIDRFCETQNLTLDDRLALFEQVCDAVSYAHQHLVIHRDLKPGNILVTGDGQVKLLDFGIAKLLDATGVADETHTGLRVMTPEVAAPEQVRGLPVSTATDVYALGILLYQLITGRRPYEVRDKSPGEFERIVCDVLPVPPSEALKGREGERAGGREWIRRVEGDLDLIVMTALQKKAADRYQSPNQLALDLHRFRNGFAISARPDTLGYRTRKFLDRHRAAVIAGAIVVGGLVSAGLRERALRNRAEVAATTAAEVQNFLVDVFQDADPAETAEPGTITARTLLDRGARRIDSTLGKSPDVQAELRTALGRVYNNLGMYQQATPLLERALAQRTALHGDEDTSVATSKTLLGLSLMHQDRFADAEKYLKESLALRERLLGPSAPAMGESAENLASLYEERGRFVEAESLHRVALRINRLTFGSSSVEAANSMNNVALVLYLRSKYPAAESLYRSSLAIEIPGLGEKHSTTAATMHNLAQTLDAMGQSDSAEMYYRRSLAAKRAVLGDLHPSVTIGLNNLGQFLANGRGKYDEAEAVTREAIALDKKIFGEKHTYVAEGLRNLGIIARARGNFARADSSMRAAIDMDRAVLGDRDHRIAIMYYNLAQIRQQMFDMPGAIHYAREGLSQYLQFDGNDHWNTNVVRMNLARMIVDSRGNMDEADMLLAASITHFDTAQAPGRAQWIITRRTMGEVKLERGRPNEAIEILRPAVELSKKEFGPESLRTATAKLDLGRALLAAGRRQEGAALIHEADAVIQANRVTQPWLARQSAAVVAQSGR
jgi:serine/threonine-protein kinase